MELPLTYFGNPILRQKARPVEKITPEIRQLVVDMMETMFAKQGAGLAAPQIGRDLRIFVICYENKLTDDGQPIIGDPKVFINPKLISLSEETIDMSEGCLSIPGLYGDVVRPKEVTVEALDIEGSLFREEVSDWRARVILHENDHLNGVLFIDRMDPKARKALAKDLHEIKKTGKKQC